MPVRPQTFRPQQRTPVATAPRASAAALGYGRDWQATRLRILGRDHYLCRACGKPAGKSAHCDHIVPKAEGGADNDENLQTLCQRCHSKKTARENRGF